MEPITIILIIIFIVLFVISFIIIRRTATNRDRLLPDLSIKIENANDDQRAIKLSNHGEGTAIIKQIVFLNTTNAETEKKSLDQVFPINKTYWVHNTNFEDGKDYYLAAGDSLYLGKILKNRVLKSGGNYIKTKKIFDESLKDINIQIKYNDILDVPQTPLNYSK